MKKLDRDLFILLLNDIKKYGPAGIETTEKGVEQYIFFNVENKSYKLTVTYPYRQFISCIRESDKKEIPLQKR